MTGDVMAGGIIGLLIGAAIGCVIGGLVVMLGTKIVMGSAAQFGRAVLAVLAAAGAGLVLGFVIGFVGVSVMGGSVSGMQALNVVAMIAGFLITPLVYSAILRTNDNRSLSYLQAMLVYLIQLAIFIAFIVLLFFVFRVQIPMTGMPM